MSNEGAKGVIQAIAKQIRDYTEAKRCTIRVPRGKMLQLIANCGADTKSRPKDVEKSEKTIAGRAFIHKEIIIIPDVRQDSSYDSSYIENKGANFLIAIPLIFENESYGVAQIYRENALSSEQMSLIDILAQSAAMTLYHIESSKMSRQAILDVNDAIFECRTFEEMSIRAVDRISKRLEIPSCLIYRVFRRGSEIDGEVWGRIVAGVPEGTHKIGWEGPIINNQPHLESAIRKKRLETISDLLNDSRTKYLSDEIGKKDIKAIMLDPLIEKGTAGEEKVIGILVLEACGEKEGFSAEEESFVFDAGKIITRFIGRDEIALRDFEHDIINPNQSMGGSIKRLHEPMAGIYELAEKCKAEGNCRFADQMLDMAGKLLPRTVEIESKAKRIDISFKKIRSTR